MIKIITIIGIIILVNTNSLQAKEKVDCSKISKFSPKFLLCKVGKGAEKIKKANDNRPTKGKKTLMEVFKKKNN
tara:strand:+ start:451 stop:672 length:222 start_codon:yes stop_codon:yes gene_type:complete